MSKRNNKGTNKSTNKGTNKVLIKVLIKAPIKVLIIVKELPERMYNHLLHPLVIFFRVIHIACSIITT
jgi:hypothetical protein